MQSPEINPYESAEIAFRAARERVDMLFCELDEALNPSNFNDEAAFKAEIVAILEKIKSAAFALPTQWNIFGKNVDDIRGRLAAKDYENFQNEFKARKCKD